MRYYVVFGTITHNYDIVEYLHFPVSGKNKEYALTDMEGNGIKVLYTRSITYKEYISLTAYEITIKVIKNAKEYNLSDLKLQHIDDLKNSLLYIEVLTTTRKYRLDYDITFEDFRKSYYKFYEKLKIRIQKNEKLDDSISIERT